MFQAKKAHNKLKRHKKRCLAIILALCMAMVMLPFFPATAEAAGTGVADRLNALRDKYPDGHYWNHYVSQAGQDSDRLPTWDATYADCVSTTPCAHHNDGYTGYYVGLYDCNRFDGGSQCWGFARKVFFDVFGVKCSSLTKNYNTANVQVGDYVRFGTDNYGHSFVVIERTGNRIKVVECNYNENHCRISWDREFDITASVYGLSFCYSYHASNYDEINNSPATGSPLPDDPGHRPISDGDYFIVSAVEGDAWNPGSRCLTFDGLPATNNTNGANAILKQVYGDEGHLFTVTWLGNGFYKIKLKDSQHQNLDVQGGYQHRDANVWSWGDYDEYDIKDFPNTEQWYINETNDGNGYTIQSKCSGFYLDVVDGKTDDGTNIRLWDGNGSNAQRWYFIPWGGGSAAKQRIPDGEYQIASNCNSGKALYADGDSLEIGARSDTDNQIFQVRWLENGEYEIIHKLTGSSLDVLRGQSKRFLQILLHTPNQGCNQRWLLRHSSNGSFYVVTKSSGLVLDYDVTTGSTNRSIYLYCEQNGAGEKWRFIPWGESIGQTLPDGEYQIVSRTDKSKVLSVDGSLTEFGNGINLELNSRLGDERYTFDVKYLGNGYYSIINRYSNLALGATDDWNDSANAQLLDVDTENVQKWIIKDGGDGTYDIISKNSGLYLSADDVNPSDGTGVFMFDWLGATGWKDCQKWEFVPYDRTVPVESVTLNRDNLTLLPGEQFSLQVQISPENAADRSITWESGNSSIASVDSDGRVTAKAAGSTEITVKTANGKTASCIVTVHEHSFGVAWKSDAENHWKECSCGEKSEESAHVFVWKIDKVPTEEAAGVKHEECSDCGFKRSENTAIDKLPPSHVHSFGARWKSDAENHWKECACEEKSEESAHAFAWKIDKAPTEEAEGVKHEECSDCGFRRNEDTAIDKLPLSHVHSFGAGWKSDAENHWKECACGEKSEESAHAFVWKIDKAPTEEAEGVKHEECSDCGFRRNEDTAIDKLPPSHVHSYGAGWKSDAENHWKECSCGEKTEESVHAFAWKIDKEPMEEVTGIKHEECSVCGFRRNENTAIDKLPPSHVHSYGAAWKSDAENHWKECACGEKTEESAHAFAWKIDKVPTEEAEGVKHEECSDCGFKRSENTAIDKLPPSHVHSYGAAWKSDAENHWKECACGEKTEESAHAFTWKIDKVPTEEAEGVKHEECSDCGFRRNENTAMDKLPPSGGNQPEGNAPFIKGENSKMGWDVIRDTMEKTEAGKTVSVDMNGAAVVPGSVLNDIKTKGITGTFEMGNGIIWSVNGQSFTADRTEDINFSVAVRTENIPAELVDRIANGRAATQISLSHDGEFGCTAVLTINLGSGNAGLMAKLYYYNKISNELEDAGSDRIAGDGTAVFEFTHASDYVLMVGEERETDGSPENPAESQQPETSGEETDDSDEERVGSDTEDDVRISGGTPLSPATGEETLCPQWILAVIVPAVALCIGLVILKWKKRRNC